jgi:hypothetical protein
MGSVADGADRVAGAVGPSFLDYSRRRAPLQIRMSDGRANDGEAGEGDEIVGSHETLFGGSANDDLRAPAGSFNQFRIGGGFGNDRVEGAEGADGLGGDAGEDLIIGNGGNDAIEARDGSADIVGCGAGTDTARLDAARDAFTSCERR